MSSRQGLCRGLRIAGQIWQHAGACARPPLPGTCGLSTTSVLIASQLQVRFRHCACELLTADEPGHRCIWGTLRQRQLVPCAGRCGRLMSSCSSTPRRKHKQHADATRTAAPKTWCAAAALPAARRCSQQAHVQRQACSERRWWCRRHPADSHAAAETDVSRLEHHFQSPDADYRQDIADDLQAAS